MMSWNTRIPEKCNTYKSSEKVDFNIRAVLAMADNKSELWLTLPIILGEQIRDSSKLSPLARNPLQILKPEIQSWRTWNISSLQKNTIQTLQT